MSWGVRKFSDGRQWYRTDRWQRLRRMVLSEQRSARCVSSGSGAGSWRPKSITSSRIEVTGDYSLIERTSSRCAEAATRKRLRGRFSARDQDGTNTACRSIPITTGTENDPAARGRY